MKTKLIYISLLAVILFSLDSCMGTKKKNEGKDANPAVSFIEGYVVRPSTIDETILISGTLKAFEETVLMPEVSGRVVGLNLPEGKFVSGGGHAALIHHRQPGLPANRTHVQVLGANLAAQGA